MHTIGKYLLAIIAISLLISICKTFLPEKGFLGSVFKLICGILLSSVLITPVRNIRINDFQTFYNDIQDDAVNHTVSGEKYRKDELTKSIDGNLTSYILNKASSLGLCLDVEIQFDDDAIPRPNGLIIEGNASPFAKKQLIEMICGDLNISEENVKWY